VTALFVTGDAHLIDTISNFENWLRFHNFSRLSVRFSAMKQITAENQRNTACSADVYQRGSEWRPLLPPP
jgi:hypothetical protein